jgi:PAS domain S-box-containing protein
VTRNTAKAAKALPDVLAVAGEMGERILGLDWRKTPLGPIGQWSTSLQTTVSLMLNSRFPMMLWWTSDYICFYNDAYVPILGAKHPWGLGKPVRECWSEIWHILQPLIDSPFNGGPSTWMDDICLILNRNNFAEETHFTVAYSPAPDTTVSGGIGGVLATVIETSAQVINARALETLGKISRYVMGCQSEQEVLMQAALAISENQSDFPFATIYSIGEAQTKARLVATTGIARNAGPSPEQIDLVARIDRFSYIWEVLETREAVLISDFAARFDQLPTGNWAEPPHKAMAIPIMLQGHPAPIAVMITALNPFRQPGHQYIGFIRLVTDQIAQALANATVIEAERKRAEAMAELDKAKTVFFSNISHEFRTPITLMLGPLEELLKTPATEWSGKAREPIETAHRNALRLLKLVNTLLDFSRIESGRHDARFEPIDIAGYTRNLAGNFRSTIEKAGLRFDVHCQAPDQPVYLDPDMWEKIVFNLLSNAFKYTLEGSISVKLSTEEDYSVLTVTDTGVGIPAEELPHIFDRFHRVQNTGGRTFEGTGIGLSLIRELVHLHGATIDVESAKDKGSIFTVRIPFGKTHLPAASLAEARDNIDHFSLKEYLHEAESFLPASESDPPRASGPPNNNDEMILIVDDNTDMRRHIQSVIGSHYPTMTAANGLEALSVIGEHRPALVLSDLMMPVMDGTQLLRELKQNRQTSQIPVILITARAGEDSRIEGFETGADDYLVKPFSGKELQSRIRAQLRISQLRTHAYNQMKSLFMQAPVAIQILRGPEFHFDLLNDHAARLMGLNREETIGRTVEEVLPHWRETGIIDLLQRVYATGETYTASEMPFDIHREGQVVHGFVRFIYTPLRDEDGAIQGVLITGDEITEQVLARRKAESDIRERQTFAERLEREVEARTQDLIRVNKELESFSYATSHDLQEPLRKIQMFIDRITHEKESTDLFLQKISESAVRMRNLIDSMLAYSHLTRLEPDMTEVDLNVVLADVTRDFELVIEEKQAVIRIGELPTIRTNRFHMNQLFSNLLSNSLKFSTGTPAISVTSRVVMGNQVQAGDRLLPEQKFVQISFSDNGIGFETEYSKKIFDLFQRLHGRHQYSGTGIGLTIVKKIVEQHNGYISAESGGDKGAIFHIWLPA